MSDSNLKHGYLVPLEVQGDDEFHPIPYLGRIDVAVDLKNGAYYGIVTSGPLIDDPVTRARLLGKLDYYLNAFYSEDFRKRNGAPLPGKLRIYVKLHPDSDDGIFDFLESCLLWLADHHVELRFGVVDPAVNSHRSAGPLLKA